MRSTLNKWFIFFSCFSHVVVLSYLLHFYAESTCLYNPFLVLGKYSSKPTFALFKPIRALSPSVIPQCRKGPDYNVEKPQPKPAPPMAVAVQKKREAPKPSEVLPVQPKKVIPPKLVQKPLKKDSQVKPHNNNDIARVTEAEIAHFNLTGPVDPAHLKMHQSIQSEVARRWRPPVGVKKGTECSVKFTVSGKGSIDAFEFIEKSGIPIYDLSVIRVAKSFLFSQSLWGKQFTVVFRQ